MDATAETLVATTSVLVPSAPTPEAFFAAAAYTDAWPARVTAWLRGTGARKFTLPPNSDVGLVRSQLERPLTETEQRDLVAGIQDPLLQAEFLATLNLARGFLSDGYPLQEVDTVLGVGVELDPAPDEAARWLAQVAVLEDPNRILDELEMGSLEQAQVLAFKATMPALWAELWSYVQAELTLMRQQGVEGLPYDREAGVRTLGQLGWDAPIVVEQSPPPEQAERKPDTIDLGRQQAPTESLLRPLS